MSKNTICVYIANIAFFIIIAKPLFRDRKTLGVAFEQNSNLWVEKKMQVGPKRLWSLSLRCVGKDCISN
jgi:hypothetical protein